VHVRAFAASLAVVFVALSVPAFAQDPPPPIPWVVVDLHGTIPRFPTDSQELVDSRNLKSLAQLPGTGLGLQIGLHIYPVHTRFVTVGLGGELAIGRSRQTPPAGALGSDGNQLLPAEERITSLSPQLSLNFGNGSGWSYLSGGLGQTTWFLAADDLGSIRRTATG